MSLPFVMVPKICVVKRGEREREREILVCDGFVLLVIVEANCVRVKEGKGMMVGASIWIEA